MIPIISKLFNWFIGNNKMLAVIIIMIFSAIFVLLRNQLKNKNEEIARVRNNVEYYLSLLNNEQLNNRTLLLTVEELNNSKDSIIQELNSTKEKLKIKSKNLVLSQVINTVIRDSVKVIIDDEKDFTKELALNPLTTITVSRTDSILEAKLDLKNQLTLFIETKKVYRKLYKNWFIRFLHFDFKKDKVNTYTIHNTNDLINVTDTRIIEIK